jgi:CHASE1-domain containing sensor protein
MSIEASAPARIDLPARIPPEVVERERKALERQSRLRLVHFLAVLLSLILTLSVWQYSRTQIAQRTEARFIVATNQVADLLEERLQKYELALWAGVATLRAEGNDIDVDEWRVFAETLEIEQRYEGINGIGVIQRVESEDLEEYLKTQRALRPDFRIFPDHGGTIYKPITFIEPVDINKEAVGLDMVFEDNRHFSLNKARDTATAQITGPIILVQDKDKTPGFLFFAPYYNSDDHDTLETRRARFAGAVYAPVVVSKLMNGVLDKDRRSTSIRITDEDNVIYNEINGQDIDYDNNSLGIRLFVLPFYGREWTRDIRAGLDFRARNSGFESTLLLIAGILIDLALVALFPLLSRANRRGLNFANLATRTLEAESHALHATNIKLDEALSLAERANETKSDFLSTISHEVRTPITAISGILV